MQVDLHASCILARIYLRRYVYMRGRRERERQTELSKRTNFFIKAGTPGNPVQICFRNTVHYCSISDNWQDKVNQQSLTMAKIKKTVNFKMLLRAHFLEKINILLGGNKMTNF